MQRPGGNFSAAEGLVSDTSGNSADRLNRMRALKTENRTFRVAQLASAAALAMLLVAAIVLASAQRGDARRPVAAKGASLFGLVLQNYDKAIDGPALKQANPHDVRIVVASQLIQHGSGPCMPTSTSGACDWGAVDLQIGGAAAAGAIPLPFMYGHSSHLPLTGKAARQWRAFLTAAVKRYGPGGTYWSTDFHAQYPGAKPKPIRIWQIWNEPGSPAFAKPPSVSRYVKLLKAAGATIHRQDRGAKIMTAGLFSSADRGAIRGRIPAVQFLTKMYRVKGAEGAFDYVALHPYARNVKDMINQVEQIRNVMRKNHDGGKRLAITELGWSSNTSNGSLLAKGVRGQANTLAAAFRKLLAGKTRYRLFTVDWYALRDTPKNVGTCNNCPFAGLNKADGSHKPAWNKYISFTH